MSTLKFEGPPPTAHGTSKGHHADAARELRERPEEWAIVGVYAHSGSAGAVALQVRKGSIAAYEPAGAFEAKARTVNGEARVYARYVGDPDE
jgi:hypothetical protein